MFIIGEIGQGHEGSLGMAHSYIDALADCGVDAVKFQTHIAEAESSEFEPFRVKFSYEDATRYDYWKRMEFTEEQWVGLKKHCDDKGIEFISSPFSQAAVDMLERIGVKRYKIGSGEVNNLLMLEKITRTGKHIILSSGMSNWEELDSAVEFIKKVYNNNTDNRLSVMQCTTSYPTCPENWGLQTIEKLRERYGIPVGFSDHSGEIYACMAAAALGADILEFHAVFDKRMFGPDSKSSLEIDKIKELVCGIRKIVVSLQTNYDKGNNNCFSELKTMFEKSLSVNRAMKKGDIIRFEDLEAKKPKGFGIAANKYGDILSKRLNKDLNKWDFLNYEDLEQ